MIVWSHERSLWYIWSKALRTLGFLFAALVTAAISQNCLSKHFSSFLWRGSCLFYKYAYSYLLDISLDMQYKPMTEFWFLSSHEKGSIYQQPLRYGTRKGCSFFFWLYEKYHQNPTVMISRITPSSLDPSRACTPGCWKRDSWNFLLRSDWWKLE